MSVYLKRMNAERAAEADGGDDLDDVAGGDVFLGSSNAVLEFRLRHALGVVRAVWFGGRRLRGRRAAELLFESCEALLGGGQGSFSVGSRMRQGDQPQDLPDVVEYDEIVAVHEDGVRHAKRVPLGHRQALEVGCGVVAEVADGTALKGWQAGMRGNGKWVLESGNELQRVAVGMGRWAVGAFSHGGVAVA